MEKLILQKNLEKQWSIGMLWVQNSALRMSVVGFNGRIQWQVTMVTSAVFYVEGGSAKCESRRQLQMALLYNFSCKARRERLSQRNVLEKQQQNIYLEWRWKWKRVGAGSGFEDLILKRAKRVLGVYIYTCTHTHILNTKQCKSWSSDLAFATMRWWEGSPVMWPL